MDNFYPDENGFHDSPLENLIDTSAIEAQKTKIADLKSQLEQLTKTAEDAGTAEEKVTGGQARAGGGTNGAARGEQVTETAESIRASLEGIPESKDVSINIVGDAASQIDDIVSKIDSIPENKEISITAKKDDTTPTTNNINGVFDEWGKTSDTVERLALANLGSGFSTGSIRGKTSTGISQSQLDQAWEQVNSLNQTVDSIIHTHPSDIAALSVSDIETGINNVQNGIKNVISVAGDQIAKMDVSKLVSDGIDMDAFKANLGVNIGGLLKEATTKIPYKEILGSQENYGDFLKNSINDALSYYDINPSDVNISDAVNNFVNDSVQHLLSMADKGEAANGTLVDDTIKSMTEQFAKQLPIKMEDMNSAMCDLLGAFDEIFDTTALDVKNRMEAIKQDSNESQRIQQQAITDTFKGMGLEPDKYFQVQSKSDFLKAINGQTSTDTNAIVRATEEIAAEGEAAETASAKKQRFAEANQKVADSAETTADAAKEAAEGVAGEGEATKGGSWGADQIQSLLENVGILKSTLEGISTSFTNIGENLNMTQATEGMNKLSTAIQEVQEQLANLSSSSQNIDFSGLKDILGDNADITSKLDEIIEKFTEYQELMSKGVSAEGQTSSIESIISTLGDLTSKLNEIKEAGNIKIDISVGESGQASVFDDTDAVVNFNSVDKFTGEERFDIIGLTVSHLMFVVYVERIMSDNNDNAIIRIISARKANKEEEKTYVYGTQ